MGGRNLDTLRSVGSATLGITAYTFQDFIADATGILGLIVVGLVAVKKWYDIKKVQKELET